MVPLLLTTIGISFLIWRKRIGDLITDKNIKVYKKILGNRLDSKEAWFRKINRWGITFVGVVLLLAAYTLTFGPFQINF